MTNIDSKTTVPEQADDLHPSPSPSPNQRIPPIAPPPLQEMFIDQQIRENRSRSMFTGSYQHIQYQKLKFDQNSNLPKSSLQMEDTSTFAHPSQYKQIIYINTKTLSGFDQTGRPRRHTFATSSIVSQRIPSAYREILIRKGSIRDQRKRPTKIPKYNKPTPPVPPPPLVPEKFGSESFAQHLSTTKAENEQNKGIKPVVTTNPHLSPNASPVLSKNSDFSKERSLSEESQGQGSGDGNEAEEDEEENPDEPNVYGLQYQDGFIDFVEHPPTSLEGIPEDEQVYKQGESENQKEKEKDASGGGKNEAIGD
ncbi:MAG: hypothetical protein EZS28_004946 [Streblomastix strix]|uniref:Uncharacterized protein n=1 Tax=Streblomastix strix TaxID=222440 RepID=A0A5J4WY65_9EUKA|nr:MAG: hypothetical protein EZS28_004946 [Streblomastix strix]